jgi:hypothetical protein
VTSHSDGRSCFVFPWLTPNEGRHCVGSGASGPLSAQGVPGVGSSNRCAEANKQKSRPSGDQKKNDCCGAYKQVRLTGWTARKDGAANHGAARDEHDANDGKQPSQCEP